MLVEVAQDLLNNPSKRNQMGAAGQAFVKRHQGATQRTLDHIKDFLQY
jgi:3-deoxy-D-manno-octulosonic-acid transferase